ncbi:MAG TPA: YkgJ family cysteine cluster protein [Tepidiformaceae bacterium]|jgi:Fe-S-cluster containining protein
MPTVSEPALSRITGAWSRIRPRFTAYELVLPGDPIFVCRASQCEAHCCRVFSVALGDREVERLSRTENRSPVTFLESEDGEPISLPLLQPFLLSRTDGHCSLLGAEELCGAYEGRPDACRLYPDFVIAIEEETNRPVHGDPDAIEAAVRCALDDASPRSPLVPLLLRHLECPGFEGPPLREPDWRTLFLETFKLQYRPGSN